MRRACCYRLVSFRSVAEQDSDFDILIKQLIQDDGYQLV